ncbi:MAG: symmetrical bis(5'-nucleosyl)-tetraphosphatase [Betaproteobacteria bacterium]|nr:symmetrical bis(5'-nucleosyl)-tetraphosphatase [Betaproteobacteria bacterium]
MSTYAIGDLQGCFSTLQALLKKINFNSALDRLWLVGDLVNRGPDSLACLRYIRDLGSSAITVLGNHDLHLLACAYGVSQLRRGDTLQPVLTAPDSDDLIQWLRCQRMLHIEAGYGLVHAGLLPQWDWQTAQQLAFEVEAKLRGDECIALLQNMYGNTPALWRDDLTGYERLRVAINAMTRMRMLTRQHALDLTFKGEVDALPSGLMPWFEAPTARPPLYTLITGHWSALGLRQTPHHLGIDTGCVWGRELTAIRLEDRAVFQIANIEAVIPDGGDG